VAETGRSRVPGPAYPFGLSAGWGKDYGLDGAG